VGLDSVVTLEEATGPTQIERVGRQRQVMLTPTSSRVLSEHDH
jgi:hypothetical protein